MLSFSFLGAPQLERQDSKGGKKRVELDTRKAVALAAYLALTERAHERDELAAFLYPDADTSHARAALRRTLSTLKTALGESVLEIERESIALNASEVQVDVLEFRTLVQQHTPAALARAAGLYRGDFLAGFTLRDSPPFDEWQFFEAESLRRQIAAVLEELVAHASRRRAFKQGIEHARRWLALDPLQESAHRALMLLYARDGQRTAALRQYHECVRQLDRELGVAPLPETTGLYRAIQENRLPPPEPNTLADLQSPSPTKASQSRAESESIPRPEQGRGNLTTQPPNHPTTQLPNYPTIQSAYPLVGRAAELQTLLGAYNGIRAEGVLLVIEGEAGIGKTRLAEEFLARAGAQGATVLTARCYPEQRSLAYAPFVQALHGALRDPVLAARAGALSESVRADAARLLPELAPNGMPPVLDGVAAQARFFDSITQIILQLTGGDAPGIFFVDDAQWLDEASLDLLAFLLRRLKNAPLCLTVTWRTEEIPNDHPLHRLYADALREERAFLISPARLAAPDVQTLVRVAAGRGVPIPAALAERLYRDSEGQPFFLVEALKLLERKGGLDADNALPASVRELLHSRLARVSETGRQLLSAAAVLGRSFDFDTLDFVSGRSDQETISGLEELSALGLLAETAQAGVPQYDFTHEKLRVLVYDETLLARRRLLHRRAAEALLQRTRGSVPGNADEVAGQVAGRIALHLRASGNESRAAEFYKRAGDYARSVFANRDAVENYSAALALGSPDAGALHSSIGDAQTLLGEYDAALASYETAAAFGALDADARMARVFLRRGEWARAARHLQNALAVAQDPAEQAQLYADLALAQHQSHEDTAALKHARRALKLAVKVRDERALAQVHNILGILARTREAWDDACKQLEASAGFASKLGDMGAHAAALNNLALVYHALQENDRALELAQRALELVTREGDRHRQAAIHNLLADLYHALGREPDSMAQLKSAVAIYAEIGGPAGAWQPEIWKLQEW